MKYDQYNHTEGFRPDHTGYANIPTLRDKIEPEVVKKTSETVALLQTHATFCEELDKAIAALTDKLSMVLVNEMPREASVTASIHNPQTPLENRLMEMNDKLYLAIVRVKSLTDRVSL